MNTLRYSVLFFILWVPAVVSADSRMEIPTTIQVVDEMGRTRVSTDTPQRASEPRNAPFILPEECLTILNIPRTNIPSILIPSNHPLWARIESQRAGLATLIAQLSFAPEISRTQEVLLKESLPIFGTNIVSTTTPLTCLSLLEHAVRERGGLDQRYVIDRLSSVVTGLQYGLRILSNGQPEAPKNSVEVLYAGDVLLSQNPVVASLSMNQESVRMNIFLPVHMFWGKHATATVTLFSDEKTIALDAPWWIMLGKHKLSETKNRLLVLSPQQRSLEGIYLRTKAIVDSLPR